MITLASDFGSPYPAAMRGVLLQRSGARLVDVAHDLPRQDVRAAAFWLREVLAYFPPAVHLAVVDPGVGTKRAALVVRAGDHLLVGPDNGLLLPAAKRIAGAEAGPGDGGGPADDGGHESPGVTDIGGVDGPDGGDVAVYEWRYDDPASGTFHGRDVFAPAAAAVHEAGVGAFADLAAVSPAPDVVDLRFPRHDRTADGATGEVLVVDGFGNVVTNVPGDVLAGRDVVTVDGERVPVGRSYAAVAPGERLATVGSHGNVELAANRGRGDDAFGLAVGDRIELHLPDP